MANSGTAHSTTDTAATSSRNGMFGLMVAIGFMYAAQTFPSAFTNTLLPTVLRKQGVPLQDLWFVSLPLIPYWMRWAIAPIVDSYWLDRLGRRKSWMIPCTALAVTAYLAVSFVEPSRATLTLIVAILFLKSIFTATQEVSIDAYVVDTIQPSQRSVSAAVVVVAESVGQMMAMIGLGVIIQKFGWQAGGITAALLMFLFLLPAFLRKEAPVDPVVAARIRESRAGTGLFAPLGRFLKRRDSWMLAPMMLITGLYTGALFPLLGPFLVDFGLSVAQVGAATGISLGAATLIAATATVFLNRRFGPKRTMMFLLPLIPVCYAPVLYVVLTQHALTVPAAIVVLMPMTLLGVTFYVTWHALRLGFASRLQAGTDYAVASAITRIGQTVAPMVGTVIAGKLGWPILFTVVATVGAVAIGSAWWFHDRMMELVAARNLREVGLHEAEDATA